MSTEPAASSDVSSRLTRHRLVRMKWRSCSQDAAALKFYPREDVNNQRLLRFAERMIGEVSTTQREQLEMALQIFENAMHSNDRENFERAHTTLLMTLSALGIDMMNSTNVNRPPRDPAERALRYVEAALKRNPATQAADILEIRDRFLGQRRAASSSENRVDMEELRESQMASIESIRSQFWTMDLKDVRSKLSELDSTSVS